MYYEEQIINGVLMWRNGPDSEWRQNSIEEMSQRIIDQQKEIARLMRVIDSGEVGGVSG